MSFQSWSHCPLSFRKRELSPSFLSPSNLKYDYSISSLEKMFCHERAPVLPERYHLPDSWLGPLTTFAKSCCQVSNIIMVLINAGYTDLQGQTGAQGPRVQQFGCDFPEEFMCWRLCPHYGGIHSCWNL